MYISLLQKMVNEFSWPAKIMASPFNLIKNWLEFSYLDQNVMLSVQQDMESLYLLALSQINIPDIRAILFDHITCNNTWKHYMSQSTQHYHIPCGMISDKVEGIVRPFHSHRCGALWSEVSDKGPQIAKKWLKRTNQGEHAKIWGGKCISFIPSSPGSRPWSRVTVFPLCACTCRRMRHAYCLCIMYTMFSVLKSNPSEHFCVHTCMSFISHAFWLLCKVLHYAVHARFSDQHLMPRILPIHGPKEEPRVEVGPPWLNKVESESEST